ncbi:hypothetical protein MKK84_08370 [Methylobacterium sp. E-065]|uniref:hypothetical protein n=1 Tax=Methylobacterium sp. E-065 TaxID=2836583 RepID=UPI001FBA8787|nr:hypothetical protein [Methylobacterium sp. E-065]MCJ2017438.1 hypothetical protein [Methylobacterium sp. E-065]
MFHATMRSAIEEARTLAQLDDLSRTIWQAHATEAVTDDEAQGLAEALHTRRSAVREAVAPVGIPLGRVTLFPPKRLQRAPERSVAIERRRRLACSGPMPPALASRFTTGQLAVLRIVGDEMARNGACGLCIDAIAARAGVCRRLAQAAIRLAEGDGLLTSKSGATKGGSRIRTWSASSAGSRPGRVAGRPQPGRLRRRCTARRHRLEPSRPRRSAGRRAGRW